MPKSFLQERLKELHTGDGSKLKIVNDLVADDFFSELVLKVRIK